MHRVQLTFFFALLACGLALPISDDALQTRLLALHRRDVQSQSQFALQNMDNIAPAISNATATAIAKANTILVHYSDALRVVAIPTGVSISFFGYFLLGPVLFLAAFVSGGGLCFVAVSSVLHEDTPAAAWISIAAMLLGGAMLGFIALRALNFGMFAVGAALGVILASCFKTTFIASAYPADPELAFIVTAAVMGLMFGLVAICLQKQMLIFSTAYAGSAAATFGVGHFAGHFPTTNDLANAEAGHLNAWLVLYILLALFIGTAGMMFQFWLSQNKPMPEYAPRDRRRRRRRVRTSSFDTWSDHEDDWADQVYVETVPLPASRRKVSTQSSRVTVAKQPQVVLQQVATSDSPAQVSAHLAQSSWDAAASQTPNDTQHSVEQAVDDDLHDAAFEHMASPISIADASNYDTDGGGQSHFPPQKTSTVFGHTEPRFVRGLKLPADRLTDVDAQLESGGHKQDIGNSVPAALVDLSLESDHENVPVKVR
eukprot:TRINITY_DN55824_c0_g1_i1.p1 TRINITY_DN55824_c0_g1~~TRINITY_DN55824_c0_g1_i1.p1  ORF type:complete len:486 (-),score=71.28 TRINITY_DN55824_c0_g1_i1:893-2350(-)